MRFAYDDTEDRLAERSPARIAFDDRQPVAKIDEALNKELADLSGEQGQKAAASLRPSAGPAGSWPDFCAQEARTALERDRTHERRQEELAAKVEEFRESNPGKANVFALEKERQQKDYESKVWNSIANKEFAMRPDGEDHGIYRDAARVAGEEAADLRKQRDEARAAYEQGKPDTVATDAAPPPAPGGADQRPGFQRRLERSRLDKSDPDQPTPPAAAMPVPQEPARDAIAPQDREQWLRDNGATNSMFIQNATKDDATFEKVRGMIEAQAAQQGREPSRETVARLDARAEKQAAALAGPSTEALEKRFDGLRDPRNPREEATHEALRDALHVAKHPSDGVTDYNGSEAHHSEDRFQHADKLNAAMDRTMTAYEAGGPKTVEDMRALAVVAKASTWTRENSYNDGVQEEFHGRREEVPSAEPMNRAYAFEQQIAERGRDLEQQQTEEARNRPRMR